MLLGAPGNRLALQHLLYQVYASARTVKFVSKQLIGGAGGGAEAAVHAGPQYAFSLASGTRVKKGLGQ